MKLTFIKCAVIIFCSCGCNSTTYLLKTNKMFLIYTSVRFQSMKHDKRLHVDAQDSGLDC